MSKHGMTEAEQVSRAIANVDVQHVTDRWTKVGVVSNWLTMQVLTVLRSRHDDIQFRVRQHPTPRALHIIMGRRIGSHRTDVD